MIFVVMVQTDNTTKAIVAYDTKERAERICQENRELHSDRFYWVAEVLISEDGRVPQ